MATEVKREDPVGYPACLHVEPSTVNLAGAYGHYSIDAKQDTVTVFAEDSEFILTGVVKAEQLSTLIRELQAIERNIDKVKPKMEVW